jgi:CheY-like chemotaxis protein
VLGGTTLERGLPAGDYVVLEVTDTGSGIGSTDRERIFEPFFSTKPASLGTGLGLSTSLAIVQRHGGTITVDSHPGAGSTFTVHLPVSRRAVGADERTPAQAPDGGAGEQVLLVDDEPALRDVTARVLTDHGYRVATAANGAEALSVLDRLGPVDVVVTDLAMPVMDGAALVSELRARHVDVPIVVMSGLVDGTERRDLAAAGATAVIAKPFHAVTLLDELRTALVARRGV